MGRRGAISGQPVGHGNLVGDPSPLAQGAGADARLGGRQRGRKAEVGGQIAHGGGIGAGVVEVDGMEHGCRGGVALGQLRVFVVEHDHVFSVGQVGKQVFPIGAGDGQAVEHIPGVGHAVGVGVEVEQDGDVRDAGFRAVLGAVAQDAAGARAGVGKDRVAQAVAAQHEGGRVVGHEGRRVAVARAGLVDHDRRCSEIGAVDRHGEADHAGGSGGQRVRQPPLDVGHGCRGRLLQRPGPAVVGGVEDRIGAHADR